MRRSTNRSTVVAPMSSYPVTVRNIVKSVGAYVRGERRRGLPRLDMRVEYDAPNAPNMRGRQRLGEWYPVSTSRQPVTRARRRPVRACRSRSCSPQRVLGRSALSMSLPRIPSSPTRKWRSSWPSPTPSVTATWPDPPPWTWALFILGGLISIAFGVVLFARPGVGAVTLALLFGLFNLILGIWLVVQGIELRRTGKTMDSAFPEKQPA